MLLQALFVLKSIARNLDTRLPCFDRRSSNARTHHESSRSNQLKQKLHAKKLTAECLIESLPVQLNRAGRWALKQEGAMSLARIAASAAVFTLLSAVCATAKPIATAAETNLRKAPGTKSEVLTLIPKGTTVEVGTCSNGWCQASLNGQDGYVIAQNVGMAPVRRPPPRGPQVYDEDADDYGPPPAYYGAPAYYGYYGPGPYYGYGWGWAHYGWGRRW